MRRWVCFIGAPVAFAAFAACSLDDGSVLFVGGPGSDGGGMTTDGALADGSAGGGDAGGNDGGGGPRDASSDSGGSVDAALDGGSAPKLVYVNSMTLLYSYDVVNNLLTKIATLSGCGSHANDIAIDGAGQMYIDEANDAVYKLNAADGTCTARNVLDAFAGDVIKIAARAAGTPSLLAVDPQNSKLLSLDPNSATNAHITSINDNAFSDTPQFDVACSNAGTCWTLLAHSNCSSGSSNACLYSFPASGSSAATSLGSVATLPAGLAYANGALWSFDANGNISKITLSVPPSAQDITPTLAAGTPAPTSFTGAASSSNY